jgi:hypothetical protein
MRGNAKNHERKLKGEYRRGSSRIQVCRKAVFARSVDQPSAP